MLPAQSAMAASTLQCHEASYRGGTTQAEGCTAQQGQQVQASAMSLPTWCHLQCWMRQGHWLPLCHHLNGMHRSHLGARGKAAFWQGLTAQHPLTTCNQLCRAPAAADWRAAAATVDTRLRNCSVFVAKSVSLFTCTSLSTTIAWCMRLNCHVQRRG
jgi:hypothetical protein